MNIVYTNAHQAHNPSHEIYDGQLAPYAESAARADSIISAIRHRNVGQVVAPRRFPARHIEAIHTAAYVDFVRARSAGLDADEVLYPSYFMSDTYAPVTAGTYPAARRAVDAALTGADMILAGEPVVYSLCRPPGHHAGAHTMGGYCYFNNAAIAAQHLSVHGKVAILDTDFHHGNGTQDAFYDRDDVLYLSIHADPRERYPYSSGLASETGRGAGVGYNRNYPLPLGTNNASYVRTLRKALKDVGHFNPGYLIVSAGFDTFVDDPIGGFALSHDAYGEIAKLISALTIPMLIVQEGGYNVEQLGNLVTNFLVAIVEP